MSEHEFLDEKIIELVNQVEQPIRAAETKIQETEPEDRTIYTGIKVKNKWIEFEERPFVEDKILMIVPKEFTIMEPEKAKVKYPMEQRPQTILTDQSGAVNLLFNYMKDTVSDNQVEMVRDRLFGMMRRVNPGIKPQATGKEMISGKQVAYVEFSNPVMDGKLYNLMFFFAVDGRICMGIFNCRTKEMKYWKQSAFEMMCSIKILSQTDDKEEEDNSEFNE